MYKYSLILGCKLFLAIFRQVLIKPRLALNLLIAKDYPKLPIFHLSGAVITSVCYKCMLQSLAYVVLGTP